MSQRNVEQVIGRLVTDEAFRRRFEENPAAALRELIWSGVVLNVIELNALASIDPRTIGQLADAIDPRLQKAGINGGQS